MDVHIVLLVFAIVQVLIMWRTTILEKQMRIIIKQMADKKKETLYG